MVKRRELTLAKHNGCEADLNDKAYFDQCYKEACEITAYLCKLYNINPHGTVKFMGKTVPTVLCHWDSYQLGLGSAHSDVYHWFDRYGKSMTTVRNDVDLILNQQHTNKMEDDDMDAKRFKELYNEMRKDFQDNDAGEWSKDARDWAVNNGLIQGGGTLPDGSPNYMWADILTREQMATLLYRFAMMTEKA